jgi:preprotein translocase subunit SecG
MLNLLRLLFAILVIILITPQTRKANLLLRILCAEPLVFSYQPAKQWLNRATWFCIITFLIIAFFTCVK